MSISRSCSSIGFAQVERERADAGSVPCCSLLCQQVSHEPRLRIPSNVFQNGSDDGGLWVVGREGSSALHGKEPTRKTRRFLRTIREGAFSENGKVPSRKTARLLRVMLQGSFVSAAGRGEKFFAPTHPPARHGGMTKNGMPRYRIGPCLHRQKRYACMVLNRAYPCPPIPSNMARIMAASMKFSGSERVASSRSPLRMRWMAAFTLAALSS